MDGKLNAWQTFDRVWRSVFMSFGRLPLLAAASLLFYAALSAYWQHYLPIDFRIHFVSQSGYFLLHAVCFSPLVLAVMTMVLDGRAAKGVIWSVALVPVALTLFAFDEFKYLADALSDMARHGPLNPFSFEQYHQGHKTLALVLFAGPGWIIEAATFLLAVRVILILPVLARETSNRKGLLTAWGMMRGQFGFALAVSLLSVLPFLFADFLLRLLYRQLLDTNGLPVALSTRQWEALLTRGFELTLQFVFYASLAAWLYRVIAARKATAP